MCVGVAASENANASPGPPLSATIFCVCVQSLVEPAKI
jgi:hypothetical protein